MDDRRSEWAGGYILIEDGVIVAVGREGLTSSQANAIQADEVIDASGMVATPGFINTHHHLYQSLTRNIPLMQDAPLFGWLSNHYEVWRELTAEGAYISAKLALLELMKTGTTFSSDHLYLFPRKQTGELIDAEIKAAQELGIRFQPTRGSMTLGKSQGGLPPDDTVQTEAEIEADTERLLAKYHDTAYGAMVRISLAPCSPFSVTAEQMRRTSEFARANGLRIHTHLAETLDEEAFCIQKFGWRPARYMEHLGWMTDYAWFAHSIHLSDDEVKLMGDSGAGMSHCPSSNMRLGSGIARIRELLDAGAGVSLAVDGSASNDAGNMLLEARNAMLLSRLREEKYWLTARDALWIATRGGAKVLGRNDTGSLEVGKRGDIALWSVDGLEYAGGLSDPVAALLFTARQSPVDYLIVDGKVRLRGGIVGMNVKSLIRDHNRLAAEMLERAGKNTGIDFLKPALGSGL